MKSWRVGKLSSVEVLEARVNNISMIGLLCSHCTQLARWEEAASRAVVRVCVYISSNKKEVGRLEERLCRKMFQDDVCVSGQVGGNGKSREEEEEEEGLRWMLGDRREGIAIR